MLRIFIDTFLNRNKGYQVPKSFLAQLERFGFNRLVCFISIKKVVSFETTFLFK